MTPDDGPPAAAPPTAPVTRRALRTGPVGTTDAATAPARPAPAAEPLVTEPVAAPASAPTPSITKPPPPPRRPREPKAAREPEAAPAPKTTAPRASATKVTSAKAVEAPRALAWVSAASVASATTRPAAGLDTASSPYIPVEGPDLLASAPRRSPFRPGVLIPALLVALIVGAYAATTLLWPLHAVAPTVTAIQVDSAVAPGAAPAWPVAGSASVKVGGITGTLASGADPVPIASITKVVTALLILEEMPLAVGEQGPEFRFSSRDRAAYWEYRENDESALDVPVGGSLTELQLLQGVLIGSANNYADKLAYSIWPTDALFARAANNWLAMHGVPGVQITDPTGIDGGNTADPASLIPLAQLALANPVIAGIVSTPAVELPGAGLVGNTNALLADPGVVGVKTGSLGPVWNLLSAKDIAVGDTPIRLYASVLGQPDDATRVEASRALFAELELALQPTTAVASGTVVGQVNTVWGETVDIVTTSDANVILWNGGAGTVATDFALGDAREKGTDVGSITVTGPLDSATGDTVLAADVEPPSAWWRLTHPLQLFGIG